MTPIEKLQHVNALMARLQHAQLLLTGLHSNAKCSGTYTTVTGESYTIQIMPEAFGALLIAHANAIAMELSSLGFDLSLPSGAIPGTTPLAIDANPAAPPAEPQAQSVEPTEKEPTP